MIKGNLFLKGTGIAILLGTGILLGGCGSSVPKTEDTKKVEQFSDTNSQTAEEKTKLKKAYENAVNKDYEAIQAADYTITNVMLTDLDRNFFYSGLLSLKTDTIYQQQLKYYEIHRAYMVYLEEKGSDHDTLLLRNRMFRNYIDTLQGRSLPEKTHVKRTLIKVFDRYNTLELLEIEKGEKKDLKKLVADQKKYENSIKMWDWFKKEKNANYKGDILDYTKVSFDLLEPNDADATEEVLKSIEIVDKLKTSYGKKSTVSLLKDLDAQIEIVKTIRFSEEAQWIKQRGLDYVSHEKRYLKVAEKNGFEQADFDFLTEIDYEENIVSIRTFKEGLALQSEKRKAMKEKMSK